MDTFYEKNRNWHSYFRCNSDYRLYMPIQEVIRRLYAVLMQYGTVSVKDTGTFSLHTSHAEFVESGTLLTPPATKVLFSTIVDPSFSFSSLLLENGEIEANAISAEEMLARQCAEARSEGVSATLSGFGTLNNQVFEAADPDSFNLYFGLQPAAVPVIVHAPQETIGAKGTTLDQHIETREKGMPSWLFWGIIVLVASLVGLAVWMMPHTPSTITPPVKSPKNIEKKDSLAGYNQAGPVSDNSANLADAEVHQAGNDQCTIIVGAFKMPDNAEKMKQKIVAAGYSFYEEDIHGLKRVGVVMSCDPTSPYSMRDTARQQFDREAWLLRGK